MRDLLLVYLVPAAYRCVAAVKIKKKTNKQTRTHPKSKSMTLLWLMIIYDIIILFAASFIITVLMALVQGCLIDPSCAEEYLLRKSHMYSWSCKKFLCKINSSFCILD